MSLYKHEYQLSFVKEDNKWYADIKGWPQKYHDNAMMVGNASKALDYLAKGSLRIDVKLYPCSMNPKENKDIITKIKGATLVLTKESSGLMTGGFYEADPLPKEIGEIWICPVTLFVLGKYPERIYVKKL